MNILYCGDDGVEQGICLSVLSLCKYTKESLNVYILTASVASHRAISQGFEDKLQKLLQAKNTDNRVVLLDISQLFGEYLPLANMGTRFTPLCMLRLFADRVAELPDRLLYLDTDVLCCGELGPLYNSDITAIEIAGVPDRYGKWFFGNLFRHDYLNSGVLLMNLANIRKSGLFEKCRRMCREKKMFMPDQTALNKLAVKRKVSGRYNAQGRLKPDTVLMHFTTFFKLFPYIQPVTVKPWHTDRLHRELKIFIFDDILEEYQRSEQNEQRDPCVFHH